MSDDKMTLQRPWQRTRIDGLIEGIQEITEKLPGWWWYVGTSIFSRNASCGPDPTGPDAWLLDLEKPLVGFDFDDRGGSVPSSLRRVMRHALRIRKSVIMSHHPGLASGVSVAHQAELASRWRPLTVGLPQAIVDLEERLPEWWWYAASGPTGSRAACGPDGDGKHAALLKTKLFDEGFDSFNANGTPASCLRAVMRMALRELAAIKSGMWGNEL